MRRTIQGLHVKIFVLLICVIVVGCRATDQAPAEDAAAERPNILLIMADDMGFTDLGAFGAEIETPNIDALARTGVRFSNFHTSVSCSPTRSMLMSGSDNHIAGLGNMSELMTPEQEGQPGYEGHLNDRVVSLAEVMREGGYDTFMAGKWHLGDEPEHFPVARGFDRSFSMLQGGASHWADMTGLQVPTQPVAKYVIDDRELDELPADFYSSRSYADFLIDAIRENREDGRPFLAYFAPTAAHDPIHVPEPWLSKYRGDYDDGYEALKARRIAGAKQRGLVPENAPAPARNPNVPPWSSLSDDEKAWESRAMEAYAGMVDAMDYNIGRIIDFLEDIGELDNTVILFTVDNGPNPLSAEQYPSNEGTDWFASFDNSIDNIGRPGSFVGYGMGWASASAGPLDYFKLTVGEGGIRTPLLITGPGVDGDRQSDSFAYVTDIMPTILEIVGIAHPDTFGGRDVEPMRGQSLRGLLAGEGTDPYPSDAFVGGEMINGKWMRKGVYKAVLVAEPFGPGDWRLYNTVEDPGETTDLSAQHPELLEELVAGWDQYAEDVGVILSR
jgi:arylsulfatase A-like enzyme